MIKFIKLIVFNFFFINYAIIYAESNKCYCSNNDSLFINGYFAIKANPYKMILDEIPLYVEFSNNNRTAIELHVGYIYSNPFIQILYVPMFYSPRFFHNGYFTGIAI